jgi:hypothetical protein
MTEGRPLHGDGMENLQDYVNERMTYASDSDEYAEANRTLEQELADLQALRSERGQAHARPNLDALIDEAQLRVERMQLRQGAERAVGSGSQVDFEQVPPQDEARRNMSKRLDDNPR